MKPKPKYRLAQDTNGAERPWEPAESYMLYTRGWRDGVSRFAMRPDHLDIQEYCRGYSDGYKAHQAACAKACKRLKYKPEILRLAKGKTNGRSGKSRI